MALSHHINRLRQQPSHIRERVAFGVSGGVTGLVAIGWLVAMSSSGALSVTAKSIAEGVAPTTEVTQAFNESSKGFGNLLGAAGAAITGTPTDAASVNVVEVRSSSTLDTPKAEATVIPF